MLCVSRADPADVPQDPDKQLVPWWQLKPKQSSPPRQTLMHPPGEVARFVADQAIYSNKVRSGKSTQIGGELDIPQVGSTISTRQPPAWPCHSLHQCQIFQLVYPQVIAGPHRPLVATPPQGSRCSACSKRTNQS
jgi:hypothetical protein